MIDYDPFSDAVMRDPWPHYAELRREAPVFYLEKYDAWFLSRFEDIWQATTQDMFTAEKGVTPEMVLLKLPPPEEPVFSMLDMPRQRDYRRMLAPRYTRNAIAKLEPRLREDVRTLLAPLASKGRFDVYRDLAAPFAAIVIGRLIGLPEEMAHRMAALVERNFKRVPGQVGANPANFQAMGELLMALAEFVGESRRNTPPDPDSHIAALISKQAEGKPLTDGAVASAIFTLLVTGIEVVPLSVANTILYLWRHEDQRRQILDDPSLIPFAFAESLRYDQPTNLLGRYVKSEVEMRGQKMRPGQGVMFLWASGNRDENEFEAADEFDISRRPRRTLSFGHGYHKCIGEHLGNLEGRLLLEEILRVAPDYEVVEGAERVYSEFLHGYHKVEIEFTPRA